MEYAELIATIKARLQMNLEQLAEHTLDERYIASACRDYSEALRSLESARLTNLKGER